MSVVNLAYNWIDWLVDEEPTFPATGDFITNITRGLNSDRGRTALRCRRLNVLITKHYYFDAPEMPHLRCQERKWREVTLSHEKKPFSCYNPWKNC